jgi:hypothetical protein
MAASKTIYIDVDGKKVSVIGDPSKIKGQRKRKGGVNPKDMPKTKLEPTPQIETQKNPKTKRPFIIKNTGSPEGMKDASKIEGKPHSSPEGQFESKMRSLPLKVVTFKNGGKVRRALRGGGRAYGQNS